MTTGTTPGKKRGPKKRVKIGQYDVVSCPECYDPGSGDGGHVRVVRSTPTDNPYKPGVAEWRMRQERLCMKCGYTWETWYEFQRLTV